MDEHNEHNEPWEAAGYLIHIGTRKDATFDRCEDAHRAALCVNACAGMSDEEVERAVVMIKALHEEDFERGYAEVPMMIDRIQAQSSIDIGALKDKLAEVLAAGKEASDCFLSEVARNIVLTKQLEEAVVLLERCTRLLFKHEIEPEEHAKIQAFFTRMEAPNPLSRPAHPCCEFKDRTACSAARECKQCEHDQEAPIKKENKNCKDCEDLISDGSEISPGGVMFTSWYKCKHTQIRMSRITGPGKTLDGTDRPCELPDQEDK